MMTTTLSLENISIHSSYSVEHDALILRFERRTPSKVFQVSMMIAEQDKLYEALLQLQIAQ